MDQTVITPVAASAATVASAVISAIPNASLSVLSGVGSISTIYAFLALPWANVVSFLTAIFILIQIIPRLWKTVQATYRWLFKNDTKEMDELANHTNIEL
jgi:hypothetical protein